MDTDSPEGRTVPQSTELSQGPQLGLPGHPQMAWDLLLLLVRNRLGW